MERRRCLPAAPLRGEGSDGPACRERQGGLPGAPGTILQIYRPRFNALPACRRYIRAWSTTHTPGPNPFGDAQPDEPFLLPDCFWQHWRHGQRRKPRFAILAVRFLRLDVCITRPYTWPCQFYQFVEPEARVQGACWAKPARLAQSRAEGNTHPAEFQYQLLQPEPTTERASS